MYSIRRWSVRHARSMESFYNGFEWVLVMLHPLFAKIGYERLEKPVAALEKLTKGQELQLRLQSTVEGLSIAAISYYVISLLLYGAKALKSAGLPINPEMAAGLLVPLVLWSVWRTTKRIHDKLHASH